MKMTFLGTGTSVGVPSIGCDCAVCTSENPKNSRLRASIYVETGDTCIVVDTPPDFRTQVLAQKILRVDAVLLTHCHADHVLGFDDIRRFNAIQGCAIPAYGSPGTIEAMKRIFGYVLEDHPRGLFRPKVEFAEVTESFAVGSLLVKPMVIPHGPMSVYGYRIDSGHRSLGYVPDCSEMRDETVADFKGVDVMVLDALRHKPHPTHLSVEESVSILQRIGAKQSFVTHLSHDLEHEETQAALPEGIFVPHDGLAIEW